MCRICIGDTYRCLVNDKIFKVTDIITGDNGCKYVHIRDCYTGEILETSYERVIHSYLEKIN